MLHAITDEPYLDLREFEMKVVDNKLYLAPASVKSLRRNIRHKRLPLDTLLPPIVIGPLYLSDTHENVIDLLTGSHFVVPTTASLTVDGVPRLSSLKKVLATLDLLEQQVAECGPDIKFECKLQFTVTETWPRG
jgi:hypothetical protein